MNQELPTSIVRTPTFKDLTSQKTIDLSVLHERKLRMYRKIGNKNTPSERAGSTASKMPNLTFDLDKVRRGIMKKAPPSKKSSKNIIDYSFTYARSFGTDDSSSFSRIDERKNAQDFEPLNLAECYENSKSQVEPGPSPGQTVKEINQEDSQKNAQANQNVIKVFNLLAQKQKWLIPQSVVLSKKKCLILPEDNIKQKWNIIVALLLIYTAIITPFRIAFYDEDDLTWTIIDWVIIGLFTFDIIFNLLSAYYDEDENLIIDHKEIFLHYLKSWLIIDVISVIPLSQFLELNEAMSSITRLAKLPRLYRLVKMTKLVRMLKIVKERGKFAIYLKKIFKISTGVERLLYFAFVFLLLCHINACIWYFIAKMDNFEPNSWYVEVSKSNRVISGNFQDLSMFEIYIASLYFIITIITTVGFGDINSGNTSERIFSICIMCIGVMSYSFAVGSLSSVLSSIDSKKAKLRSKMETLDEFKREYDLNDDIYIKLKKVIKYDHSRDETEKFKFLNELPQSLKLDLAVLMHHNIITKIPFFQKREPHFLAFLGPLLRPVKIFEGQYIFSEDEPIDGIYFLTKGAAALVLPKYSNLQYVIIEEGFYFGELDFFNMETDKRIFAAQAITDCEILTLNKEDLAKLLQEYPEIINELLLDGETKYKKIIEVRASALEHGRTHQISKYPGSNLAHQTSSVYFAQSLGSIVEDSMEQREEIKEKELKFSSFRNPESSPLKNKQIQTNNEEKMEKIFRTNSARNNVISFIKKKVSKLHEQSPNWKTYAKSSEETVTSLEESIQKNQNKRESFKEKKEKLENYLQSQDQYEVVNPHPERIFIEKMDSKNQREQEEDSIPEELPCIQIKID